MVLHPVSDAPDLPPTPPSPPPPPDQNSLIHIFFVPKGGLLCVHVLPIIVQECSPEVTIKAFVQHVLHGYMLCSRHLCHKSWKYYFRIEQYIVLLLFRLDFLYTTHYLWPWLCFILITVLRMGTLCIIVWQRLLTQFNRHTGTTHRLIYCTGLHESVWPHVHALWCDVFLFSLHQRKYLMQQFGSCRGP